MAREGWQIARILTLLAARPLLVAATVVPVMIFVAAAAFDYQAERTEVRDQILATSTAFAEHAQTVVETADLVIARVLDRVESMDWQAIQSSADLHDFLLKVEQGLPQIESVFLAAPDGRYVASSRQFPLETVPDVSDRDYFQQARAGATATFISKPFKGRVAGTLVFTASRPRLRGGVFDGVAGVTISSAYFRDFYASAMDYPGQSAANLVRADGTVLFRYPAGPARVEVLPPESVFVQAVAKDALTGVFEGRSSIDGRLRMGAYRRLRNQPLFASYSVNATVYLAAWRANMVFVGGFSIMLAAALLLTERVLIRRTEAEKQAAAALLQETERRRKAERALEQMQKMEALGRLTGGVAHDFNNLLTAILGPLELAAKRTSDPRILRLLSGASQAAQRGAKLTAQMLAVARQRDQTTTLLAPNAVILELGEMLARTIGPMIELSYDLDPAATAISADTVQFEMTLVNLCVNARDAMADGGKLTLRTRRAGSEGGTVEIAVIDTGEGMPEDVRARALEPFFTTKAPGKGTGLGLSTAYGFAQAAGGSIAIDSAPGRGTIVTLALPFAAGMPEPAPAPGAAGPSRQFRILLVDDDAAVRGATHDLLDDAGHNVVDAAGGMEALGQIRGGGRFDLMVTDYAMPGMDGAELADAARALAPSLPVLFVTGYAKGDALAEWERRGSRILDKPFTGADLARAIQDTMTPRPKAA